MLRPGVQMVSMYQDKEIIDKTKELVKTIKDDSLYKEYMELRLELKANKNINNKIEEVKRYQRKFVKGNYQDKEYLDKINSLVKELETIPLYYIYRQKEEELNNNLLLIKEGLRETFSNIVTYEQN